jgi:hypothetical protein
MKPKKEKGEVFTSIPQPLRFGRHDWQRLGYQRDPKKSKRPWSKMSKREKKEKRERKREKRERGVDL